LVRVAVRRRWVVCVPASTSTGRQWQEPGAHIHHDLLVAIRELGDRKGESLVQKRKTVFLTTLIDLASRETGLGAVRFQGTAQGSAIPA
jgi:hypothetical protein